MAAVYQIKNELNGEFYIGFTSKNPPEKRFSEHKLSSYNGSPTHLHRAMRKYGIKEFSFSILEEAANPEHGRKILEPRYIAELKPEYNMTGGGEGTSGRRSERHQRNMSEAQKNSGRTRLHLQNLADLSRGIPRTHEVKMKCSIKMMGHVVTSETRNKISETLKGRIRGLHSIIQCPHCQKTGGNNSMPRWHFDNCKERVVQ